MKIIFARTPKPKRFNFPTRYYDPRKEEMEKRKKQREGGQLTSEERIRGRMQSSWHREDRRNSERKNIRSVIIYLFIAAVLIYLIFFAKIF
ncbi:MAG: hypothetical protein EOL88_02370 [Bacteroidia bacterium]|nr:hypothetical protein [Bacteroidia bacterium]